MALNEHIEGVGDPKLPVKVAPGVDFSSVVLSAQEGFVLSRIDGNTSVAMLCIMTGIGEQSTLDILRRLRSQGIIVVGDEPPVRSGASATAGAIVDRSESINATPIAGSPDRCSKMAAAAPVAQQDVSDDEDEDEVDLSQEVRRRISSTFHSLGALNYFELLGVKPDADAKTIRRAYFVRSKEFHPDRYYTKKLGRYKEMLAEIFKQLAAAHKFLEDNEQRRAYAEMVRQEMGQEQLGYHTPVGPQTRQQSSRNQDESRVSGEYQYSRARGLRVVDHVIEPRSRQRSVRAASVVVPTVKSSVTSGASGRSGNEDTAANSSEQAIDPQREARRQLDRVRRRRMTTNMHQVVTREKRAFEHAQTSDPAAPEHEGRCEQATDSSRNQTAESYFKRAVFEESMGRRDTAGRLFVRAADVCPKGVYLQKAAQAMLWTEDLINAREYATKAVQAEPESPDARLMLARVYLATGMEKNARRELEMALKIAPSHAEARAMFRAIKRG